MMMHPVLAVAQRVHASSQPKSSEPPTTTTSTVAPTTTSTSPSSTTPWNVAGTKPYPPDGSVASAHVVDPTAPPPPPALLAPDLMVLAQGMRLSLETQHALVAYDAATLEDFCLMTQADFSSMVATDARLGRPIPPLQQRKLKILLAWCHELLHEHAQEQQQQDCIDAEDNDDDQEEGEPCWNTTVPEETEQVEVTDQEQVLVLHEPPLALPASSLSSSSACTPPSARPAGLERQSSFRNIPKTKRKAQEKLSSWTSHVTPPPSFWNRLWDPLGTLQEATRLQHKLWSRRHQQEQEQQEQQRHSQQNSSTTTPTQDEQDGSMDAVARHVLVPVDWQAKFRHDLPHLKRQLQREGETQSWSIASDSFMTLRWILCGYQS